MKMSANSPPFESAALNIFSSSDLESTWGLYHIVEIMKFYEIFDDIYM